MAALVDADEAGVPLQLIGDLYGLANPVKLPAGATIRAVAHFDNSSGNPANPDPNRTVRWGPQTSDGMNSLEEAKAIGNILRRR